MYLILTRATDQDQWLISSINTIGNLTRPLRSVSEAEARIQKHGRTHYEKREYAIVEVKPVDPSYILRWCKPVPGKWVYD